MPKVLLADDSATMHKVVDLILKDHGYQVVSATSGEEALEQIKTAKPDIILVHAKLPGINGYTLCEKIKANPATKATPVILLTGAFEPIDEAKRKKSGAEGSLVKPFQTDDLLKVIKAHIKGGGAAPAPAAPAVEEEEFIIAEEEEAPAEEEFVMAAAEEEAEEVLAVAEEEAVEAVAAEEDLWSAQEAPEESFSGVGAEETVALAVEEEEAVMVAEAEEEEAVAVVEAEEEAPPAPAPAPKAPARTPAPQAPQAAPRAPQAAPAASVQMAAPEIDPARLEALIKQAVEAKVAEALKAVDFKALFAAAIAPHAKDAVERAIVESAPQILQAALKDLVTENLSAVNRELENIMWETVPDLAESLINQELAKIKAES